MGTFLGGSADFRRSVKQQSSFVGTSVIRHPTIRKSSVQVPDILRDLKEEIAAKRIRLKDFMAEGDRLRLGEVSKAKFRTALARAGLELEDHELAALERVFSSRKNA